MNLIPTAKLALRVFSSSRKRLDFPYKLNFAVTGRCNLRCKNCFIWMKETGELSLDEIREFFRKSNRFAWVDVTGGEVFMREDILEVFDAIIRNCRDLVFLHYPTNGTLPEKAGEAAEWILKRTPARLVVTVSLDGPRAVHDKLRGQAGTFDSAIETFLRVRKANPGNVYFGFTFSGANLSLFDETLREVREKIPDISIENFHFNIPHRSPHYYGNEAALQPDYEAVAKEFARLDALRPKSLSPFALIERRYAEGVGHYCRTGKSPISCSALSSTVFMNQEGKVYPCTIFGEVLGNIRDFDYDMKALWESPKAVEVYKKAAAGECPNCWTPCESFPAIGKHLARTIPKK